MSDRGPNSRKAWNKAVVLHPAPEKQDAEELKPQAIEPKAPVSGDAGQEPEQKENVENG